MNTITVDMALRNRIKGVMKHEEHADERDHADLASAGQLVSDGRNLRKRVFARLRARAFRKARKSA